MFGLPDPMQSVGLQTGDTDMEMMHPPRLPIAANLNFGELADTYMLAYRGRDVELRLL